MCCWISGPWPIIPMPKWPSPFEDLEGEKLNAWPQTSSSLVSAPPAIRSALLEVLHGIRARADGGGGGGGGAGGGAGVDGGGAGEEVPGRRRRKGAAVLCSGRAREVSRELLSSRVKGRRRARPCCCSKTVRELAVSWGELGLLLVLELEGRRRSGSATYSSD